MPPPKKPEGEKYETPKRMAGRINDDEWAEIQAAAESAIERGAAESQSQWIRTKLLAAARSELRR